MVGAGDAQIAHRLGVGFFPPTPGQLEPVLDHVAMSALDFPRANGPSLTLRPAVIQLTAPLVEIPVSGVDRWEDRRRGFAVRLQCTEHFPDLVVQQVPLVAVSPRVRLPRADDQRRRRQIFADVVKVQQIGVSGAKVFLKLGRDPRGPISHAVNPGARPQPGGRRRRDPDPGRDGDAAQRGSVDRRGVTGRAGAASPDLPPKQLASLARIGPRAGLHDGNQAAVDLRNELVDRRGRRRGGQGGDGPAVAQRVVAHGGLWHGDGILFLHSLDGLAEGNCRAKIRQHALQAPGIAARVDLGFATERAQFGPAPIQPQDLFGDRHRAKGGWPADFLLDMPNGVGRLVAGASETRGLLFLSPLFEEFATELLELGADVGFGGIGATGDCHRLIEQIGQGAQACQHQRPTGEALFQGATGDGGEWRRRGFRIHEPHQLA